MLYECYRVSYVCKKDSLAHSPRAYPTSTVSSSREGTLELNSTGRDPSTLSFRMSSNSVTRALKLATRVGYGGGHVVVGDSEKWKVICTNSVNDNNQCCCFDCNHLHYIRLFDCFRLIASVKNYTSKIVYLKCCRVIRILLNVSTLISAAVFSSSFFAEDSSLFASSRPACA